MIMLYGEMGAGKTVFVKGIGKLLGVERIISPTFVIYYEYEISLEHDQQIKKLYHFDLYKIETSKELEHLGIKEKLQPGSLICIEWSEKSNAILEMLRQKATIINVHIEHLDKNQRKITYYEDTGN